MICSCGARYPDSDEKCTYCGALNSEYKPVDDTSTKQVSDNLPPVNPWDAFPGAKPYVQTEPSSQNLHWEERGAEEQRYNEELRRRARISANISLICGIFGNIFAGPIFGPLAVFQGRRAKRLGYSGAKATVGIVLGVFAIIFWLVFVFLVIYFVPRFLPQLMPYLPEAFRF